MDEIRYGEILPPEPMEKREERVKRRFWKTLAKAAGAIPFAEDVVAAYYCALDTETPTRVKATLLGALAYFVMPLDIVPDFLALVGFTDDATVLMMTIAMLRAHIKPVHREAAKQALARARQD